MNENNGSNKMKRNSIDKKLNEFINDDSTQYSVSKEKVNFLDLKLNDINFLQISTKTKMKYFNLSKKYQNEIDKCEIEDILTRFSKTVSANDNYNSKESLSNKSTESDNSSEAFFRKNSKEVNASCIIVQLDKTSLLKKKRKPLRIKKKISNICFKNKMTNHLYLDVKESPTSSTVNGNIG